MARVTQRDVMQDLNRRFGADQDKVVAAYAAAERHGDVRRASNVHGITPEEYARRLYADGVAKGWIGEPPVVDKWDDLEVELTGERPARRMTDRRSMRSSNASGVTARPR